MGLIQIVSLQFPQDLVIIRDSRGRRLILDLGALRGPTGAQALITVRTAC